ncbi:hypothetical protein A3H16_03990 [Candidatus Kaiserbacteria bacterium RIFCSPLOWO2_12_FULL_53_8]|uniref:Transposase IS200-like domain-containing protein n=2 Tax=Candidatus Kaiseribacteriota TaxID=1752734 RepID=A0A1F6CUQ8_9BACT|nr:MAG: hypothetical protein A2851_04440 [Candidatus Kaiserbacteria bacterium RIFCSPHIGHO2_01_FULL_53_29]OGG91607.1 MAG: hypothetical protein A3H16_03990 [Candidatus Kaiserbacteria bacterium RIFCSPLOWO2_12_FULL_53_8]
MANRPPFELGEWYHCFSRGVEKRKVFENELDANRFLMLLYLANGTKPIQIFNTYKPELSKALKTDRGTPIVAVSAYCLMPNHFHLLLKEVVEGGISSFMRKLGIAYTMYFNEKNERVGNLFVKPFRSRRIGTDRYFQRVLQYIHCNPAELYEPAWKSGSVRNIRTLEKKLVDYPYSSLRNYSLPKSNNRILSKDGFDVADHPSAARMIEDARSYYADIAEDRFER